MKKAYIFIALIVLLLLCIFIPSILSPEVLPTQKTENLGTAQTVQELYEKAKLEEGIIVYTISSRVLEVAKSFEKQYPGLTVQVVVLPVDTLVHKMKEEISAGTFNGDVVFCSNADGLLLEPFLEKGWLYNYVPDDIGGNLIADLQPYGMPVTAEAVVVGYNSNIYSSSPVSNIWELTEEKWRGKVYAADPERNVAMYAFLTSIFEHKDFLIQAYPDYYDTPYPGDEADISKTYMRKLVENELIVVSSNDDIIEVLAAPGSDSDAIGIIASSKLRVNNIGYSLAVDYAFKPFPPILYLGNISIVSQTESSYTSMLFVRWIMGEADGQGEGYHPYLTLGAWPTRTDVTGVSPFPSKEDNVLVAGGEFSYIHQKEMIDFWKKMISER